MAAEWELWVALVGILDLAFAVAAIADNRVTGILAVALLAR